jgi:hypothetical protein
MNYNYYSISHLTYISYFSLKLINKNMNENQQTQGWYGCDSCRKPFPTNQVNQYCLDDSALNSKLCCILCFPCYDKQLGDKKQTGCFPLMIGCPPNQEIKTQGFKR